MSPDPRVGGAAVGLAAPNHDPMCPSYGLPRWVAWWQFRTCDCEFIAKVRADERARVLAEYGLEEQS